MNDGSQNMASFMVPGGGYGYTGMRVDAIQCPDNTVATGLLDESGSTTSFARPMELCVKEVIKSLRSSPRADNLLYRHTHFGSRFREIHGFKALPQINVDDYDGCYQPGGCTTLFDSEIKVIQSTRDYCAQQTKKKFMCNGFIYIITDGCDYGSVLTQGMVREELAKAISSEDMESLMTILIGVNPDPKIQQGLADHAAFCGFTQYVPLDNADEKTLAKLADFVSRSLSSQSQSLGTGGPSQSLTF
jgi:uncharacterized protein YegL